MVTTKILSKKFFGKSYDAKTNPNGGTGPFVRFSKDMKFVEIVIVGWGPIYRKKIGKNPEATHKAVEKVARRDYRLPI